MYRSFLPFAASVCMGFCLTSSAVDQKAVDDVISNQQSIMSKMDLKLPNSSNVAQESGSPIKKDPLSSQPIGLPKAMATVGSAVITYTPYNFQWMIFSGGWYWNSSDQYSSFYTIDQNYENYASYSASITLYIWRSTGTAYDHAVTGVTVATKNNATIYQNKTLTTFNGFTAYYNSYSYTTTYQWSVDEWHFTVAGVSYTYKIFTTVADWNANSTYYNLLKIGLFFPAQTLSKSTASIPLRPQISYYPNTNGSVTFSGLPSNAKLFIYDISGNLIRSIVGNTWDGLTDSGTRVTSGFYVTNIKMAEGESNIKIFKK